MQSIHIDYQFTGDQTQWQETIDGFIAAINDDPRLKDRFHYQVFSLGEDGRKIHIGRWDAQETLDHLQSQPFFKTFASAVKGFAGDTLKPTRGEQVTSTF